MEKVAWHLLENAQAIGIATYLLATLMLLGIALWKGYLVIGKTYDKQEKAYDVIVAAQESCTSQLADQRVMNAELAATMKALTADIARLQDDNQRLQLELALCRGRQGA